MSSPASPRSISDELWALFEPLIPPQQPAVHGRTGRPRVSDRDVLEGIPFVPSTGIGWTKLPRRIGRDSSARLSRHRWVGERTQAGCCPTHAWLCATTAPH
jgi:transposase